MQGDERRRFRRVQVPLYYRPARLLGSRQPARDLSVGGIRILTDDSLPVGKRLEIELFLPDGGSLNCEVRVAWVRELDGDEFARYEAGLQFMSMDDSRARLLERCLATARGEEES